MALPKLRFWKYDESAEIATKTFENCDAGAYEPSSSPWWRIKIWNDKGDEQGSDKATSIKMTVRDTDGGVSELWTIQHWIEIKSDGAVGIADATITAEADVDFENDKLTITIDIPTGEGIKFTTDDTLPDPLVVGTLYYAIRVDATHIKIATTLANADAGAAINLTDAGVGTHTVTVYIEDDAMPGFQSVGLNKELTLGDIPKNCYRILYIRCHPPTDAIENPTVAFVLRVTHQEPSSSICKWITGLRGNGIIASTGNPFAMSTTGATDPIPYGAGYALINNNEIYYGSSGTYDITTAGSGTYTIYLSESGAFNETTGTLAANELPLYEATISSGVCTALTDKRVYLAGIRSGTTGAMPSNPNLSDVYIGTNGHIYIAKTAGTYTEQTVSATQVEVSELGTATYDDVQDWLNNTQSGGRISGGTISGDSSGGITISSGTGFIQTTTGNIGLTKSFDWTADSIVSTGMSDDSANYVYIDYGAGTPTIEVTNDRTNIHLGDHFTLGRVYKSGTDLHILQSGVNLYNMVRREHERLVAVRGFERASGGVISESAVTERAITSTIGIFYLGANKITTEAQDTSTGDTDTFTYWYYDGANWQSSTGETQISKTQYNASTGLANLTANRYGVHWGYIHFESDIHVIYGQDNYTLAQAEDAVVPDTLPSMVEDFGILASKIIIQQGSTGFSSVVTAYKVLFPVSSPPDHNDLGSLQGGAANEYYHLNSDNYTELNNWAGAVTLSTGGTISIPSGQEYQINGAEVKLDDWATPTTGTTLDSSTGRHGLLIALDGSTGNYLRGDGSWQPPPGATGGATNFLQLTDTPANYTDDAGKYVKVTTGEDALEFATPPGGEANTASNAGTTGIGIYYQKDGIDLQFKGIHSTGNILVTDSTGTHTINLDVDSTGIALDSLGIPSTGTALNATTGHHGLLPILSGTSGEFLNGDGNFTVPPGTTGAGATTFLGLTDTPANYTGAGGKVVKVTTGEDALEFISLTVYHETLIDVQAVNSSGIHAAIAGSTASEQTITTNITNPDTPRNLSITVTQNSTPSGDITIYGTFANGTTGGETITISTGGTDYGDKALAKVSQFKIPVTVSSGDTVSVGWSDKIGLCNSFNSSGDIFKLKKNAVDVSTGISGNTNPTYNTINLATITNYDDYEIWYKQ